ncbi:MAG: endonuclease III domain-containing protein [Desulfonatronovibrionaceae bacterium]
MQKPALLLSMYQTMLDTMGPSNWWPGETPFEVAVGAILTQNTSWKNVEKAIFNLKAARLLEPSRLFLLSQDEIASYIRPAGYYRVKALRLKNFLYFLNQECGLNFSSLAGMDSARLREKLLAIKGIGPETADSIMLYGLNKTTFVVDAYTRRIFNRHSLVHEDVDYHELKDMFESCLPGDAALYGEYHALLVRAGKQWCRKKNPLCLQCPLNRYLDS